MFVNEFLLRLTWTWEDGHHAGSYAASTTCCSVWNRISCASPSRLSAQVSRRRDSSSLPIFSNGQTDYLSLPIRAPVLKKRLVQPIKSTPFPGKTDPDAVFVFRRPPIVLVWGDRFSTAVSSPSSVSTTRPVFSPWVQSEGEDLCHRRTQNQCGPSPFPGPNVLAAPSFVAAPGNVRG